MTLKDINTAYPALQSARLTQMADTDKWLVILSMRQLRTLYDQWQQTVQDVRDKLKDDAMEQRREAFFKQHPAGHIDSPTIAQLDDIAAINRYFDDYNKRVDQMLQQEAASDVPADYARLTEEAFKKLLASNPDLTLEQIMALETVLL